MSTLYPLPAFVKRTDTPTHISDLIGFQDNSGEPKPLLNYHSSIIALIAFFLTLSWICVTSRLYTRFKVLHSPGWDDFLIITFLITGTACSVLILVVTRYGLGAHLLTFSASSLHIHGMIMYVWNGTYALSTTLIKMSLLFQYLRIFQGGSQRRNFCIIMIIVTALWGTAFSFIAWFPCLPMTNFDSVPTGHCYGFRSNDVWIYYGTFLAHSASNMALDMIILFIPLPLYFKKDTDRRTRLGLVALFIGGCFVGFFSVFRLVTIIQHRGGAWPTFDPTWYGSTSVVMASLEVNTASICASVPVFWPMLTASLDRIFVVREFKVEVETTYQSPENGMDDITLAPTSQVGYNPYGQSSQENLTKKVSSTSDHVKTFHSSSYDADPFRVGPGGSSEITIETQSRRLK